VGFPLIQNVGLDIPEKPPGISGSQSLHGLPGIASRWAWAKPNLVPGWAWAWALASSGSCGWVSSVAGPSRLTNRLGSYSWFSFGPKIVNGLTWIARHIY
jgi:hypothetical protein